MTTGDEHVGEDCEEIYGHVDFPINIILLFYGIIPAIISLLGNTSVVYIVSKSKRLQTPTNILLSGASASDALMTAFAHLTLLLSFTFHNHHHHCQIVHVVKPVSLSIVCSSAGTLTILTHARYRDFRKGLYGSHRFSQSSRWIYASRLLVAWVIGFLVGTVSFYGSEIVSTVLFIAYVVCCVVYISYCCLKIRCSLRDQEVIMRESFKTPESASLTEQLIQSEKRCSRATILVLFTLLLTWLPFVCIVSFNTFHRSALSGHNHPSLTNVWIWVNVTGFFNCAINPFIYYSMHKSLRREMLKRVKTILPIMCCSLPSPKIGQDPRNHTDSGRTNKKMYTTS